MQSKPLSLLGMMKRAAAIVLGEDNCEKCVKAGKAKVLLIGSDISDNAEKKALAFVSGRSAPVVKLPYTKMELGYALGRNECSMAAVTEIGFADAFMNKLTEEFPEYKQFAEQIESKHKKNARRIIEKKNGTESEDKRRN